QRHVVHAGLHDRHTAPRLGKRRDHRIRGRWPGPAVGPAQRRRPRPRHPAAYPRRGGHGGQPPPPPDPPPPGGLKSPVVVHHLYFAATPAHAGEHLVPRARATMPDHVGARLRHREQEIGHTIVIGAQIPQCIAQHVAHDRHAERLTREDQAELNVHGGLLGTSHPSSHPLLRSLPPPFMLATYVLSPSV